MDGLDAKNNKINIIINLSELIHEKSIFGVC